MNREPIRKPMKAELAPDLSAITYPVLSTPKLDGIRCMKVGGRANTTSFNRVGNQFIADIIERSLPDGVDGEITVVGETFSQMSGSIRRSTGQPRFLFSIFDYLYDKASDPYVERMRMLAELFEDDYLSTSNTFEPILPIQINCAEELAAYEQKMIDAGYEGVMVRTPNSPYKFGRATVKEGYLLKLKRFEDAEAVITGSYERMHNNNIAVKDNFGRSKRSHNKENLIPTGELGGFNVVLVQDSLQSGNSVPQGFDIGYNHKVGGISASDLWRDRHSLVGKYIKFKHQPCGAKDAPRLPIFLGFRDEFDM